MNVFDVTVATLLKDTGQGSLIRCWLSGGRFGWLYLFSITGLHIPFVLCYVLLFGLLLRWFFNDFNGEPEALPPTCCIISLALCATLLLSIADDSLEAGSSVTACMRLTIEQNILTK